MAIRYCPFCENMKDARAFRKGAKVCRSCEKVAQRT